MSRSFRPLEICRSLLPGGLQLNLGGGSLGIWVCVTVIQHRFEMYRSSVTVIQTFHRSLLSGIFRTQSIQYRSPPSHSLLITAPSSPHSHHANTYGCDDHTISLWLPRHLKCERRSSECDVLPAIKQWHSPQNLL